MRRFTAVPFLTLLLASSAQAQVLITEVQPNPVGSDNAEWVEIHNTGTAAVDIGGWVLHDGPAANARRYSFPLGTMLAANQVIIVTKQATQYTTMATAEGYAVTVPHFEMAEGADDPAVPNITGSGGNTFALNNGGDVAMLEDGMANLISGVEYGSDAVEVPGAPAATPGEGETIGRVANTGSSIVDFTVFAVPTPGMGYAGAVPVPPTISNETRAPAGLVYNGQFTVSATVTDADGVEEVEIRYAIATSTAGAASTVFTQAPANASGNAYGVTRDVANLASGLSFPPPTAFNQRYVRYFIWASDPGGATRTSPASATNEVGNAAYYWENVLPNTAVATIADVRAQNASELPIYDGHTVRIEGVVLTTDRSFQSTSTNFFMAASTGIDAIRVFDNDLLPLALSPGDVVRVTGKVGVFRGVRQVGRDERSGQPGVVGPEITVQVIGTAAVPMPTVTIASLLANGEQYESQLVQIDNLMFDGTAPATWAGNSNNDVTDGTGVLNVRVVSGTTVAGMAAPTGTFGIRGILTQFAPGGTGGYQLQPRAIEDVLTGVPPVDGGVQDTGMVTVDGGEDSGVPPADTGVPPADTGVPPADTGVPPADTGVPPADTGVATNPDATVTPDSGAVIADAGPRIDTGVFGTGDRDSEGCNCAAEPSHRSTGASAFAFLGLGLLVFVRRRR